MGKWWEGNIIEWGNDRRVILRGDWYHRVGRECKMVREERGKGTNQYAGDEKVSEKGVQKVSRGDPVG